MSGAIREHPGGGKRGDNSVCRGVGISLVGMGKTRNTNGERDREGDPGSKIPEKENPTKKKG